MKIKATDLFTIKISRTYFIFLLGILLSFQTTLAVAQQLELFAAQNNASPNNLTTNGPKTINGPAIFRSNTARNTSSGVYTPQVTLTLSFSDQQYTSSTYPGMTFGAQTQTSPESNSTLAGMQAFNLMNATGSGSPVDSYFTSGSGSAAGTNFDVDYNYGFHMFVDTYYQRGKNRSGRYYYGKITFTFSRPVVNPVLHFTGMGGAYGTAPDFMGFYTEFELDNSNLSLTRLSGNPRFNVTSDNKILNSATAKHNDFNHYTVTSGNASAGSVRVNSGGVPVTSITFSVYIRGDGGEASVDWSSANRRAGDGSMISASLDMNNVTISGNVYNDTNGLTDNTVNGAPFTGTVYATLVNASSGLVVGNQLVNPVTGGFTFTDAHGVTPSTNFIVVLNQSSVVPGTFAGTAPVAGLPPGWISTGEFLGTGSGHDGIPANSRINVAVGTASVTNVRLGIQRPPVADNKSYFVPSPVFSETAPMRYPDPGTIESGMRYFVIATDNSALTGYLNNGLLTGRDAEDCPDEEECNEGSTFVLSSLYESTILFYDFGGEASVRQLVPGDTIPDYNPSKLVIYAREGSGIEYPIGFTYSIVDAAGFSSPPASYTILTESALPVELLYFNAAVRACNIYLEWATASELNNDYFTLYRSTDFHSWEELTRITGNGTSSVRHQYSFTDSYEYTGLVYYRIGQTDFDGVEELLPTVSVNLNCTNSFVKVYPNPANNIINVVVNGRHNNASEYIVLTDVLGRVVSSVQRTDVITQLDISGLAAGNYYIRIIKEGVVTEAEKVMVVR